MKGLSFIFVSLFFLSQGCGDRSSSGQAQGKFLDQKYPTLCESFQAIGKFALSIHLTKDEADFNRLKDETVKELAEENDVSIPPSSAGCEDLLTFKKKSEQALYHDALKIFMQKLDPHSNYLSPEESIDYQKREKNEATGIGVVFKRRLVDQWLPVRSLTVEEVFPSTPAEGFITSGDKITGVNNNSLDGKLFFEAIKMITEAPSKISIKLSSGEEIDLTKAPYKWSPVMVEPKVYNHTNFAAIKIREFTRGTADAIKSKLKDLEKKMNVDGWLVDMRNNPGGLLDEAVKVVGIWSGSKKVVVTLGNPNKKYESFSKPDREYRVKESQPRLEKPMVIITNQGTASASELFSGSLALDRAIVTGERTFGKGTGFIALPLSETNGIGGALLVTTFRYVFPDGYSPQAYGVRPHIELKDDLLQEVVERRRSENKPVFLFEEDYGKDRIVASNNSATQRVLSANIENEKTLLQRATSDGRFAKVCDNKEDCQMEMASAYLNFLHDSAQ